jgi:DNA-binding transcriptional regulator of glucitol operon
MRRVLAPKWWGLHIGVLIAVLVMLRLGLWQWHRAESSSGGIQNYAYAFQWPLFACFAIFMWAKSVVEEVRRPAGAQRTGTPRRPMPEHGAEIVHQPGVRIGITTKPIEVDEDDTELAAWNARFAALNARHASTESRER